MSESFRTPKTEVTIVPFKYQQAIKMNGFERGEQ